MMPKPPRNTSGSGPRPPHFGLRRRAGALALYGLASLITSLHATPRQLVLGPVRGLGLDATPQSFNASHETLAAGDINNDGLGDAVAISTGWNGSPRVSVALGQPGSSFISGPAVGETVNCGGVALHDINHDGNLDLLLAEFDAGELRIRTGNGDGTFNPPTNYPAPGVRARSIRVADFDGDGNIDVAMNTEGGGIRIFHFNAHGLMTSTRDVITASGIGFMETGDFDADGTPDLVFAPYSSEQMFFLTELRTASPQTTGLTVSGYSGITGLRPGNLPGNAHSAVVFASARSNKAAVLPDWQPGTSLFEFAHNRARQALLTDLNGDDLPDLLIVGDDPANPDWRNNQQFEFRAYDGVSFGDPQIIKTGLSQVTWVTTRDMNDDGLQDVLIALDGGSTFIIFNETPLPPRFVSPGDATFEVGEAGSFQVEASGHGNITYSLAAGTLPVGMSLSASGLLNGTPAVGTEGDHAVTFAADNGVPPAATQAFTLTVIPRKVPLITSPSLAGVTAHTAQMGASIGNDWGFPITRRGFVYSLTPSSPDPRLGGNGVAAVDDPNPSLGGFNTTVFGLAASSDYSFAAFAENARGVSYTAVVHFQTLALPGSGSLVVTTAADEDDGSSDPNVGTGTSLREAIAYANALGGAQTITFSPNLLISGPATLPLTLGQLWYDSPSGQLTIDGPGADTLTLNGGGTTRLLWHNNGSLTINGLTFTGGAASNYGNGGAIRSAGTLRLNDCYFRDNSATSAGGAVYSLGECVVERCSFLSNNVTAAGGNSGHGGAIASENRLFVYNSTFHDNHAMHDTGDQGGTGGAISHPFGGGIFRITNATITGNSANVDGGGIYSNGVSLDIRNSIISGNTAPANANANIPGANVSNSLIDSDPAAIFATGLPTDHGGTMPTIALKSGGPAIDSGDNALATDLNLNPFATDQRGVARIVHGTVDIGAYEYVQTPTVAAASVSAITDTGATLGGEVSDDGHGQVHRGFVFARAGENPAPAIGGVGVTELEVAGTTGAFSAPLLGLLPLTDYSYAVFAENEAGGVYGTVGTFRTTETPSLVVTLATDTANPSDGQTSLREALAQAASLGGPRTITFASALSGQTIALGSQLSIATEVVIQGPGASQLTISGGNAIRTFHVTATGVATLSGLTIANGRVDRASYPEGNGGGILNQGDLTLLDSVLSNNQAGGTHLGHGGGLHHAGRSLVVTRCTFSGNRTAAGGYGGGPGRSKRQRSDHQQHLHRQ